MSETESGTSASTQGGIGGPLLSFLETESTEWAASHGVVMYSLGSGQLTHAPFTLLPTRVPAPLFLQAQQLSTLFNTLLFNLARDSTALLAALDSSSEDSFTCSLVEVLKSVESLGVTAKYFLGVYRSDYMLHCPTAGNAPVLQQVEINTIAASFSNLSAFTTQLHNYLLHRHTVPGYSPAALPQNPTLTALPAGMAKAFKLFGNSQAVVLMVVHPNETNTFDQRWMEYNLWEQHGIKTIRRSLGDIAERATLLDSMDLLIDGVIVAIVYFRAGYSPDDYPTQKEWDARLLAEKSNAIKCPSIGQHLAGSKKIQQLLTKPGEVEKYLPSHQAEQVRRCFAGLYSLSEGEDGVEEIISKAKQHPENFVLKPQREGGGNNLYGKDILHALSTFSQKKLSAYILMDRIKPPSSPTYFMRNRKMQESEGVSELGIFGVIVGEAQDIILNEMAGHLLRTKVATVDDGGVAAGVAVLDSPYLIDA